MKKAILLALSFMALSFILINSTLAIPDLNTVFADLTNVLGLKEGLPVMGGAGTPVDVALISQRSEQKLYPGGSASSASAVKNEGEGNVYFRVAYAVQYDEPSWHKMSLQFQAGQGFEEHDWQPISVAGVPYRMKVFTYTLPLAPGATSPEINLTVGLAETFTSEELQRYRADFLQTQVLAIDPTPFTENNYTTPVAALDLALPLDTLSPF